MKQLFSLLICCALLTTNVFATDIIVRPSNVTTAPFKRSPISIPQIDQNDHTLTFDSSCIGCTITLLQDDIIIYSATVEENDNMEGEVVLPDYLTGVFELQLERGSITFVGEIEL